MNTDHLDVLDWFTGTGEWMAVSHCTDEPRGTRHETFADALNAVDAMNLHGCSSACRSESRHKAVKATP